MTKRALFWQFINRLFKLRAQPVTRKRTCDSCSLLAYQRQTVTRLRRTVRRQYLAIGLLAVALLVLILIQYKG